MIHSSSWASIDSNWVWAGAKRTLKVFINVEDPILRENIRDALGTWNAANTGWTFDFKGTAADNDVEYKEGELKKSGGGCTDPDKKNAKGEIEHVTVTFDHTPEEGFAWGDGSDHTKSILGSILHELSHVIGLDHEGGLRKSTGKIADPGDAVTGDMGATAITAEDSAHAKETGKVPPNAPPEKKKDADLGPASGETILELQGHVITFPHGVYQSSAHVTFSTDPHSLLPASQRPTDLAIVKGVDILSTSVPPGILPIVDPSTTVTLSIPYIDATSGPLLDLVDPDWGGIDEANLVPAFYNVDLGRWVRLWTAFTVDSANNIMTFSVSADLLTQFHAYTPASLPDGTEGIAQFAIACDAPGCLTIMPILGAELSQAGGGDCEYHAPPGASINATLTLSNTGNATLFIPDLRHNYVVPPTGTWLTVGGEGPHAIAVGFDESFPVTMNTAGLAEGLYQAQITIMHNDPTKISPFIIPVDFFVFNSFTCPEYVVLHTEWLELEVSSVERVTAGPERTPSRVRGLFRPPYALSGTPASADSGANAIYDGSLIIARPPVDVSNPPDGIPDTVVYRYVFGTGNYAKGFRSLSNLTVDTAAYGTGGGIASATANQTTVDSLFGIDVKYDLPQSADSSQFVLVYYRIFNRMAVTVPGLIFGEAVDFDVVPATVDAGWQSGSQNTAGFQTSMNLVYQQGIDSGTTTHNLAEKYLGGMTAIQNTQSPRAWSAPNDPWLYGSPGGGFSEGYIYQQLMKTGFEIIPPVPVPTQGYVDQHSVIAFEKNVTLTPTTVKHYVLGFVTSTQGPSNTDLINQTKKAWRFAFGWKDVASLDTLPVSTPATFPYYAIGSHELGPTSGCGGCVITKTSDPSGQFNFTPDADPCTGTINFTGAASSGIFSAVFRLATPACSGPTYTEDHTITVVVQGPACSCPHQGDIDGSGFVDVSDVLKVIGIAFVNGTDVQDPICPKTRGDVNNDGVVDVNDVLYIIRTAFLNGPNPVNPCGP